MQIGIVGKPNVGKSTFFNGATLASVEIANYPFTTIEANKGIAYIRTDCPHREFKTDCTPNNSKCIDGIRYVPIEMIDVAGLVPGAHEGKGLGNKFLGDIRGLDALVHVLRFFRDEDVSHVYGEIDPGRDVEVLTTELILADLEVVERRIERVRKLAKSAKKEILEELSLLERMAETLGRGVPLRYTSLVEGAWRLCREIGLLTAKPVVYVVNVDESDIGIDAVLPAIGDTLRPEDAAPDPVVGICGKLEAEIGELPADERTEFLGDAGLDETGLNRLIRIGYRLLDLVTFYTTVGTVMRAWTLSKDSQAVKAAGKVHSDMERGFIKAEVIDYETFVSCGSEGAAREKGLIRVEGKDYLVQDGDIVHFRFRQS